MFPVNKNLPNIDNTLDSSTQILHKRVNVAILKEMMNKGEIMETPWLSKEEQLGDSLTVNGDSLFKILRYLLYSNQNKNAVLTEFKMTKKFERVRGVKMSYDPWLKTCLVVRSSHQDTD